MQTIKDNLEYVFIGLIVITLLVGYHFYDKAQMKDAYEFEITKIQDQIQGQLPKGVSLESLRYYQAGRISVGQELQETIRRMEKEGTIEDFSMTVQVDDKTYNLGIKQ